MEEEKGLLLKTVSLERKYVCSSEILTCGFTMNPPQCGQRLPKREHLEIWTLLGNAPFTLFCLSSGILVSH